MTTAPAQEGTGSPSGEQAADPVKNIKAEMQRKFEAQASEIATLKATSAQLAALVKQQTQKAAPPAQKEKSLEDLHYSDPVKALEAVEERAVQRAESTIMVKAQAQARTQAILADIERDYPEMADSKSDMMKRAVEIFRELSPQEQANPIAYKTAALQAAQELDVLPVKKRPAPQHDNYQDMGNGYNPMRGGKRKNGGELAPEVQAWAEIMSDYIDVDNPETKARLIKRSERDWTRPQQPISTKKGKK